jgi:hypothetical protein
LAEKPKEMSAQEELPEKEEIEKDSNQ